MDNSLSLDITDNSIDTPITNNTSINTDNTSINTDNISINNDINFIENTIIINAGGTKLTTYKSTLSRLSPYFESLFKLTPGSEYFIDVDGLVFRDILAYLRHGLLPSPIIQLFKTTMDYLQIEYPNIVIPKDPMFAIEPLTWDNIVKTKHIQYDNYFTYNNIKKETIFSIYKISSITIFTNYIPKYIKFSKYATMEDPQYILYTNNLFNYIYNKLPIHQKLICKKLQSKGIYIIQLYNISNHFGACIIENSYNTKILTSPRKCFLFDEYVGEWQTIEKYIPLKTISINDIPSAKLIIISLTDKHNNTYSIINIKIKNTFNIIFNDTGQNILLNQGLKFNEPIDKYLYIIPINHVSTYYQIELSYDIPNIEDQYKISIHVNYNIST